MCQDLPKKYRGGHDVSFSVMNGPLEVMNCPFPSRRAQLNACPMKSKGYFIGVVMQPHRRWDLSANSCGGFNRGAGVERKLTHRFYFPEALRLNIVIYIFMDVRISVPISRPIYRISKIGDY